MYQTRKAVMAVIYNDENKFLIGSSPRDGGFKFPQGGIEGDEDIYSAIKREVLEETGVELLDSDIEENFDEWVTYQYQKIKDDTYDSQTQSVFKIKFREDMDYSAQDEEFDEFFWVDYEKLKTMDLRHRKDAYLRAVELCNLHK